MVVGQRVAWTKKALSEGYTNSTDLRITKVRPPTTCITYYRYTLEGFMGAYTEAFIQPIKLVKRRKLI